MNFNCLLCASRPHGSTHVGGIYVKELLSSMQRSLISSFSGSRHIWRAREYAAIETGCRVLSGTSRTTLHVGRESANKLDGNAVVDNLSYQRVLHVAIAGLPNAGKSTLLNFIVGDKVAAVSPKRHTTTKNILGITTLGNSQIYFHDTPGFTSHHDKADCRSELSRAARDAINLVHLTLVVVDASKPTTDRVLVNLHGLLEQCVRSPGRLALVLNKIDLVNPKQHLLKKTDDLMKKIQHIMEQMNVEIDKEDAGILDHNPPVTQATGSDVPDRNKEKRHSSRSPATNKFKRHRNVSSVHDRMEVFMISAKSGDGVGDILKLLERQARPGRWHFDSGKTSNMSELLRATEIIRESLYVHLHQEIPYTITQCTRKFHRNKNNSVYLEHDLCVERETQKRILLTRLRYIHRDVERDLTKLFGTDVIVCFNVLVGMSYW